MLFDALMYILFYDIINAYGTFNVKPNALLPLSSMTSLPIPGLTWNMVSILLFLILWISQTQRSVASSWVSCCDCSGNTLSFFIS